MKDIVCLSLMKLNKEADSSLGNARTKELVPADRLLVIRLEDGRGWEQICPFAKVDISTIPYPRMNDAKQLK
ncbi:hypothetical protein GGR51DRAFT_535763 [Nemania sp. FL0031]|nr:hypothetical protein GGR51DRAFT_535763 [Nemania sp. FL0031]